MDFYIEFIELIQSNNIKIINYEETAELTLDTEEINKENDEEIKKSILKLKKNWKKQLKNPELRNLIISKLGRSYELVQIFQYCLSDYFKKSFKYIYSTDSYFIGIDMIMNMYCIYYKNLLVFDMDYNELDILQNNENHFNTLLENISIDNKYKEKENNTSEEYNNIYDELNFNDINYDNYDQLIIKHCQKFREKYNDTYQIYKSNGGYHIFVISRTFNYNDKKTIEYMLNFGCDFNYIVHSHTVGFVVRLNKKHQDDNMYKYISTIGENKNLEHLVQKHIILANQYCDNIIY